MFEVEIFSDIICPWCYIGKKRLDTVLAGEMNGEVSLRWRPFQLYPRLPAEGVDRLAFLRQRYGDDADPGRIPERIKVEAEQEGIGMRYDRITRTPNTLLAHRAMEFAYEDASARSPGEAGQQQHALAEALFQAYFCDGKDVGDLDVVLDVAAATGMDRAALDAYLQQGRGAEEVQTQLARAPELGISGVPGYYLADAFLLPGAQSAEVMAQILTRVRDKVANG